MVTTTTMPVMTVTMVMIVLGTAAITVWIMTVGRTDISNGNENGNGSMKGTLPFEKINITEAHLLIIRIHFISTVLGSELWLTKLRYLECKVRTMPLYFVFAIDLLFGVRYTKVLEKPGRRSDVCYPDFAKQAVTKALSDAKIPYTEVQQVLWGYVYGDSSCGQRALYMV
uniref:Uncharacterized protein n=1 Tax=Glossina morsitans morsitans TaxID=37546 RepID=A0A1B0G0A4_GLOMM